MPYALCTSLFVFALPVEGVGVGYEVSYLRIIIKNPPGGVGWFPPGFLCISTNNATLQGAHTNTAC